MKATFACKDVGMACGFTAEAPSTQELMPKIAKHAKEAHGIATIPDDLMKKVSAAIKTKT